ncbi:MAG: glycosyltransferase [Aestuariibacter sp.]
MPAKSVVLYDFLQVKGGAEAVTLDLCRHFKHMDLIAGWINRDCFPELGEIENRSRFLAQPTSIQGWQTIKCARAFLQKCPNLSSYENVIFSGSNAPLAILKTKAQKNIYYCHTPPRFVYDLKEYYFDTIPTWQKPALNALIAWFQPKYEQALSKMDVVLCNSKNVQGRLKKHLNVDAEVLYPPVNTERFKYLSDGDYFLSTARLEPYKRVETIVRAFMEMPDKKLIVTSGGSQELYLRELAKDRENIQFTGWVSEEKLADLMGNCMATIYIPKDEDFGMSPLESHGAGKPVIGVSEGGVLETIENKSNGYLLPADPGTEICVKVISELKISQLMKMRNACQRNANLYDAKKFFEAITKITSHPRYSDTLAQ